MQPETIAKLVYGCAVEWRGPCLGFPNWETHQCKRQDGQHRDWHVCQCGASVPVESVNDL